MSGSFNINQINVNVTDVIPPDNFATIDKNAMVGTVYTKAQDNEWRAEVEQNVTSGIKGVAKPDDVVPATGFFRMLADTATVYTNYIGVNDAPIEVTDADLNIFNGVQRNEVIFEVTNGVTEKKVFAKVGADGANGTATIPQWVPGDYSPDAMVVDNLLQYIAPNGADTTDIPGVSYKWFELKSKSDDNIKLIDPSTEFQPNSTFMRPNASNSQGESISYSNADFYITSAQRLKGINLYCQNYGVVFIDFYTLPGGNTASFLNDVTKNNYEVKKGWNYIDEKDIDIPFFDGFAYVGVRAVNGVIGVNSLGASLPFGKQSFEVNTVGTYEVSNFIATYNIVRYSFDLLNEINSKKYIQLPKGQIDIYSTIVFDDVKVKGYGVLRTRFNDKRSSPGNLIELSNFAELSDVGLKGLNNNLNKDVGFFNDLTSMRNNTGHDGYNGLVIKGLGVRVSHLQIENFGGTGLVCNGQTTRLIHSFISSVFCYKNFIGFDFQSGGEYCNLFGLAASNNILGIKIIAGNTFISSGTFNDNRIGLYMGKLGNDSHGAFTASQFNHSKLYSMVIDNISNGHSFVACHVFEGDIYLVDSIGFNFTGGTIDASIYVEGGKTQRISFTSFQNNYWDRTEGIHHNFQGITSYLKMQGNFFMLEAGENDSIINN